MTDQTELGVWKNTLESSCVSYGSKPPPHNLPIYCGVYLNVWKTKKSFFDLDDKSGVTIRL